MLVILLAVTIFCVLFVWGSCRLAAKCDREEAEYNLCLPVEPFQATIRPNRNLRNIGLSPAVAQTAK